MPDRTVLDVVVAGLPGAWNTSSGFQVRACPDPVDAILRREGVAVFKVRHEEAAALMASAYARLTGGVGVCLAVA